MLARPLLPAALLAASTASGGPSRPAAAPQPSAVAIVGGTIHVAPGAAPMRDGVLVVDGGRIAAVGPRASTPVPVGARMVDARGGTVLAAFWNAHVHLIGPQWSGIDTMAAPRAQALLRDAFGRFGFAHVADIGSFDAAPPLRRRIEAGELSGPEVLTTLAPFVPRDGTPVYLPGIRLPELHDAARARDSVRARVAQGADAIKLFVVPITARAPFPVMAPEIVVAVADEAHRAGSLVVAHPVVDGDPTRDVRTLARVRLTMRRGRVLYEARAAASPSPAPDGIEVALPVPPAPVRMGDADRLAYELHVTNLGDAPVMLAGVEVHDAGAGHALASITDDALPPLLGGRRSCSPR